jgi:hypothetical protein
LVSCFLSLFLQSRKLDGAVKKRVRRAANVFFDIFFFFGAFFKLKIFESAILRNSYAIYFK